MKVATFILLLFLSQIVLSQQFDYITHAKHNGSVTYLDLEFLENQSLLVSGWHRDSGDGIIWKYNLDGNVIDSIVFNQFDLHGIYLIESNSDSLFLFGRCMIDDVYYAIIQCVDLNLNLLWTKQFEIEYHGLIKKVRSFEFKKRNYLFMYGLGNTHALKFDLNYNLVQYEFLSTLNVSGYDPIDYVDTGFVFPIKNYFVIVDTLFNLDGYEVYPNTDTISNALLGDMIKTPDNGYWQTGESGVDNKHSIIHFSEAFQEIKTYPLFGSDSEHSKFGYLRSIACNPDTSVIYASGTMRDPVPYFVDFGSPEAYPFFVARMAGDSLMWYNYYTDGNYYFPINMEVGPDNALYLACTRYDVANQPNYSESVIMRISPEGDLPVGMHSQPNFEQQVKVYPNPGSNSLQIKLPESGQASLLLYNMQGAIVKSATFYSEISLTTSDLPTGIYMYRINTSKGETVNGKWVKQ